MVLAAQLEELQSVLQAEAAVHEELLTLSHQKQKVLIQGKLPELEEITKREEFLVTQVGELEKRRAGVNEQLSGSAAVPVEELTLPRIVALAPEPQASDLAETQCRMARVMGQLGRVNSQNAQLVKQSLDYTNFSLNLIFGADTGPTYPEDRKGRKKVGTSRLLDKRV